VRFSSSLTSVPKITGERWSRYIRPHTGDSIAMKRNELEIFYMMDPLSRAHRQQDLTCGMNEEAGKKKRIQCHLPLLKAAHICDHIRSLANIGLGYHFIINTPKTIRETRTLESICSLAASPPVHYQIVSGLNTTTTEKTDCKSTAGSLPREVSEQPTAYQRRPTIQ
jgi:hypothetical protein